ncbi:MAG: ABC transporter ATP-binding protein [Chloroflexi bacterium]|nr:ABC transporter ATP-binding protein [Chloroflexota bacterium]|tara:strand:+ start:914 stop:1681 length:768 start_codon:yes stop_codon:yes gene_type:complete
MTNNNRIEINNLSHNFGGIQAIKNISFNINKGELVGLIGPNGCGKSTTFNCLSGLIKPAKGTIFINGINVSTFRPDQIQKLGMTRTFQHTRLWKEMTVIENILVSENSQFSPNVLKSILLPNSRSEERERIDKAFNLLELLGVSKVAHNLAGNISGGQSKLVDIARAMMSEPDIILLDEPVAGVANDLAEKIFLHLRNLVDNNDTTILVIEHNMDFILRTDVDKIIVMNMGEILMEGTSNEVRKNKSVAQAYLGS